MDWKINDVVLPSPTDIQPEINDLYSEETGRDEAGVNHIDLVRAGVRKWNLTFEMITLGQLKAIEDAVDAKGFGFTGFKAGGWVTVDNCHGKLSGQKLLAYFGDGDDDSFWGCQLAVVEN